MFTRSSLLVLVLSVAVGVSQVGEVAAQPQPVEVVVQPIVVPGPAPAPPAMIGITVTPVTVKIGNALPFAGARVDADLKGRALWQPGRKGPFKFNPGGDVIYNVNGVGVKNAGDITANLIKGWNKISTYDTSNGGLGTYDVYCD